MAQSVAPSLRDAKEGSVAEMLLSYCPADGLAQLLSSPAEEVTRAAVVSLGVKGSVRHSPTLLALLRSSSREVAGLAEDSLWRIWMRAGSACGNRQLAQAIERIDAGEHADAVAILDELCGAEPEFAEAHHQRGIALTLLERLDEAAEAFEAALEHNPNHFSAAVSLGHVYAQKGQLRQALRHYRAALKLNPGLHGIPETVDCLESVVGAGPLPK